MLLTVTLLVFATAIIAFFSQEFIGLFKKIFAIPGAKLIITLGVISWVIFVYEAWGLWILLWCKWMMHRLENILAGHLSVAWGKAVVRILLLFIIACLPIWITWFQARRKPVYRERGTSAYFIGLTLWILAAILLTV